MAAAPAKPIPHPFEKLLEYKFREVSFPTTAFRVVLRQDLVEHRAMRRDGAHIEATGRAPLEFSATIPFVNTIEPGKAEKWERGKLYPQQWRKFIAAMADRSGGFLQHPELGRIFVKPHGCETDWNADKDVGGVRVSASWVEETDDPNDLAKLLAQVSPMASAIAAAADVDRHLKTITPPLPSRPEFQPDFEDTMRAVQGVFDQVTLTSRSVSGKLDAIMYRVDNVVRAADAAFNAPGAAAQHVKNWVVRDAAERLKSAANDVKKTLLTKKRRIGLYVTASTATLASISIDIPAPINELMTLNPTVLGRTTVERGARLRYYLPG